MIDKTVNGWNVHEAPEGLTFEHVCTWDEIPSYRATDKLRDYVIKGMFADGKAVILLLVKNGTSKMLKLTSGENGNHIMNLLELHPSDFRQIYKVYCERDDDAWNQANARNQTRQIIE